MRWALAMAVAMMTANVASADPPSRTQAKLIAERWVHASRARDLSAFAALTKLPLTIEQPNESKLVIRTRAELEKAFDGPLHFVREPQWQAGDANKQTRTVITVDHGEVTIETALTVAGDGVQAMTVTLSGIGI